MRHQRALLQEVDRRADCGLPVACQLGRRQQLLQQRSAAGVPAEHHAQDAPERGGGGQELALVTDSLKKANIRSPSSYR